MLELIKLWNLLGFFGYILVPLTIFVVVYLWLTVRPQDKAKLDAWLDRQDAKNAAKTGRR